MPQQQIFSLISLYCAMRKVRMEVVDKALNRIARKHGVSAEFMKEVFAHCLNEGMTLSQFLHA